MTKVISISDDAYDNLSSLKNENSFSEVILMLTKNSKKNSLMKFAGKLDNSEWEKISKDLKKERKLSSRRMG